MLTGGVLVNRGLPVNRGLRLGPGPVNEGLCVNGGWTLVNPLPFPGNFIGAVHGRRGTPGLTGDAPEVPW